MSEENEIYFKALGIDPDRKEMLREAYDKAHDIRKFEIEMYWRRSAYLWTIQAAALAALAFVAIEFDSVAWDCSEANHSCKGDQFRFVMILAIWSFGTFSAYIWLLLLKGAKYWQNN